ncbi:hypothetical protein FA95DRAFT_1680317 [Auriscalpium vulgare]|uniref:Uncharacterized protein n=1 Tax=Auriscalpium vulgare TaxID=40419 RepID=A0ACB8RN96_9AGAM|nr:hypothetical protein FA95DRAFT_1680317 [Auriscalpium vulgare]
MSTSVASGMPRRLRGRLSALPTMPLDILFEIFSYLPPGDLVQLARVTKPFRQVLLSRSQSALLWTQSYELVPDVPPCPEDMSEPAWAHLLFGGSYCYTCGTKPVNKIMFLFRRRACKNCIKKHMYQIHALPFTFDQWESELLYCIPVFIGEIKSYGVGRFWWDSDVEALRHDLDALLARRDGDRGDAYRQDLSGLADSMGILLKTKQEHVGLCEGWEDARIGDRSVEIMEIKEQRFDE